MMSYLRWSSDAGLVRRALRGHSEAFGVLVERHLPMAHALAWGHVANASDAEDVVQEAFLRAYTKLDSLRESEKFAGWLAGIVRNLAADARVRARRGEQVGTDVLERIPAPVRPLEQEEIHALLHEAILGLETPAREVLTLYYFSQTPVKEIARLQEISTEAAFKRLQRAREALGVKLLASLETAPRASAGLDARKKAILAAVAAAPVAWKAAAGGGVSLGVAGVAVVFAVAGGLGILGYERYAPVPENTPSAITAPEAVPATTNDLPTPGDSTLPQKGGRIFGHIYDVNSHPVNGATVQLELVDWKENGIRPLRDKVVEVHSDASGAYSAEGLKFGSYSLVAFLGNAVDAQGSDVSPTLLEHKEDLYLKPGLPVAGRVVSETGEAIAGAMIEPKSYEPVGELNDQRVTAAGRAVSDAQGKFRIGLLWPGGWQFTVCAKGYGATQTHTIEAGTRNAVVTMSAAARVEGHVLKADTREAVPGAKVVLSIGEFDRAPRELTSAKDGAFAFDDLAPGIYHVGISTVGLALDNPPDEFSLSAGERFPVELMVGGGGAISGKVVDKETGEGVASVRMDLRRASDHFDAEASSDAMGGFYFPALSPGEYSLYLHMENGVFPADEGNAITLTKGQEVEVVRRVKLGVAIAGMVVDSAGSPLKEASVMVSVANPLSPQPVDGIREMTWASSDASGKFMAYLPDPAEGVIVRARHDKKVSAPLEGLTVPKEGVSGVVLRVDEAQGAVVEARMDTTGFESLLAAQQVEAMLTPTVGSLGVEQSKEIAANGTVLFDHVATGAYTIKLRKHSGEMMDCTSEAIEVVPGKMAHKVEITCLAQLPAQQGDFTFSGVVESEDGGVVAGATVAATLDAHHGGAHLAPTTTDANGTFVFANLPPGGIQLNVSAPGYRDNSASTEIENTHFVMTLYAARMIMGRAVDLATGKPVTRVSASVMNASRADASEIYGLVAMGNVGKQYSDPDGRFSVEYTTIPGQVVVVRAAGYRAAWEPVPEDTSKEMLFKLEPGVTISGRVFTPEGLPLSGVTVTLDVNGGGDSISRTTSAIDGTYSLSGLVGGVTIYATHPEYALTQLSVPENGALDIVMARGGVIVGRLTPPPKPGERYQVQVRENVAGGINIDVGDVVVSPDGTFRLERLPDGEVKGRLTFLAGSDNSTLALRYKDFGELTGSIVNGQQLEWVFPLE